MSAPSPPLTRHVLTLTEFGDFAALPDAVDLEGFKAYLRRVWAGRTAFHEGTPADEPSEELLAEVRRNGQALLQFDGREVRARNYCGLLRYGPLTLRIVPKLFAGTALPWEGVFRHLQYYLSYGHPAYFPFDWSEATLLAGDDPLAWLAGLFARFARHTLSERPLRTYTAVTEAGSYLRGRLDVGAYLREQLGTGQWQHVHNEYSAYQLDNPFNQVVRYVAAGLLPLAGAGGREDLRDVLHELEGVTVQACTVHDCDRLAVGSLPPPHGRLLAMCRWFLAGALGADAAGHHPTFTFLVPAERVFEEFITGFIGRHFPGWRAEAQRTAYLGTSAGKPAGLVRNDLWLPGHRVVVDVKYKCIEPHLGAVPPGDLYQMLAYAIARQAAHVHLVYPAPEGLVPGRLRMTVPVPASPTAVTILVHFVTVTAPAFGNGPNDAAFLHLTQHLQEKLGEIITF
jgi:5-methylcytosine-specific restriction enzyme subunit McrC